MEAIYFFAAVCALVGLAVLLRRNDRVWARRFSEHRRALAAWSQHFEQRMEQMETAPLAVGDWDGTSGLLVAVGLATDKGNLFPLVLAGTPLPARVEQLHDLTPLRMLPEGRRMIVFDFYAGYAHREVIGCDFLGMFWIVPPEGLVRMKVVLEVSALGCLQMSAFDEEGAPLDVQTKDVREEPLPVGRAPRG